MNNPPTETERLAHALFRGLLQTVKLIAGIYGWSIRDENNHLLSEQCQRCRTQPLQVGVVRVVKQVKIE